MKRFLSFSFLILGLAFLAACSKKPKPTGPFPVAVTAAAVTREDVPVQREAVGNVEAYRTVSVKAVVAGELMKVHFKEGQDVHKGDLLFTIDPRPFEMDLEKNEANLAKDVAQTRYARAEVRRYRKLVGLGYVSKEQYDQVETNAKALDATIAVDKSAVNNSKLNLQYCTIQSPIDGRTGSLLVHPGNLVKANETPYLVVINQIEPIYVDFAVPEEDMAEIKQYMALGTLKVEAVPASRPTKHETGRISFIDNAVDTTTGTIKLKGLFNNEDKALWPGEFANVIMTLRTEHQALVIPSQAVQTGQKGSYVYVIKPDMTVEARVVIADRMFDDNKTSIKEGLKAGEKVVTDGQLKLAPGMSVQIQNAGSASLR